MAKKPKQDPKLLKRIRETRDYYSKAWAPIHKHGNKCVQFVAGDPWDPKDVAAREKDEQKRPHLTFDEASQYINGFLGKARQQKRSVKVEVGDNLADKDTAEMLQGRVYHIEHKSKAQSKYIGALQDASTRGYGFFGIGKRYSSPESSNQEPYVRGFDNPDCVLMDPDCKEYDASDATGCFVDDKMPKRDFMRKHAKFKPSDLAPDVETVIVTEFWDLETVVTDRLLTIDDGSENGTDILESKLPGGEYTGDESKILEERDVETKKVTKYLCQMLETAPSAENSSDYGVEILEIEEWDDDSIPIIPVYGQRFYVAEGDSTDAKKCFLSLISRAIDPMGLLNLAASAMAERVAMMPKTRWMMASGQEVGHEEDYRTVGTNPLGFILYEAQIEGAPGTVMSPPQPVTWEPQIDPALKLLQVCKDSIRGAVGQIASPELQKNDSGIAIKRLNDTGDNASYHLIDNFAQSIERAGCILGRMVRKTHDTDRHIPVRDERDQEKVVRINAPHQDDKGRVVHYDFTKGEYAYTISTGPSHESQSEAVKDWATTLATSNPEVGKNLLDQLTEMQNFGPAAKPLIDRLKKMVSPDLQADGPEPDPAAMAAELKKGQQFIDLQTKHIQELQKAIDTKQIEHDTQIKLQQMKDETAIKVAEINQSAKIAIPQIEAELEEAQQHNELVADAMHKVSDQQHEIGLKQMDQQHATDLQQASQDHQAGMQDNALSVQQQESEAARQAAAEQPAQA